ncbi:MAG: 4Fe-4S binding protein [Candidatus Hydrogenedentota bacterium]|nr:MAG: 4Fe-4S binding protein [Candidatus Hydrogenedentota bacterium]
MRNLWLIKLRKISQTFFILILILTPVFQVIRVYRQDPFPYRESFLASNFFNAILTEIDKPLRNFLSHFYDDLSGGPYSLKIWFLKMVEPMSSAFAIIRNLFVPEYWTWILAMSFLLPLLIAFLFGRIYCGYVCPMSTITHLHLRLRKRFKKAEPGYSATALKPLSTKRKIFISILFLVLFMNPILIAYILPPALMQHSVSDFILYGGFSLWGLMLCLVFIFEWIKPAYFCRKICPTGLFLTFLGKYRRFSLVHVPHVKCEAGCHLCNEVCWLGLNPKTRENDPACDLCQRCVMVCPQHRLKAGKASAILGDRPRIAKLAFKKGQKGLLVLKQSSSLTFFIKKVRGCGTAPSSPFCPLSRISGKI